MFTMTQVSQKLDTQPFDVAIKEIIAELNSDFDSLDGNPNFTECQKIDMRLKIQGAIDYYRQQFIKDFVNEKEVVDEQAAKHRVIARIKAFWFK
jgi:hypothetical protein